MKNLRRNFREFIIRNIMKTFYYVLGLDNKKVVFKSFENQYSCNPRAISEKLHELAPDIKIVWIFSNPEKTSNLVPDYVIKIKDGSIRKLMELATSKVWVDNCTKVASTWKAKEQYYIQTWHGDKAFKKIGYDAGKIPYNFEKAPVFDLAIAGSKYGEKKYRNAFHYKGEIINIGTPRNDTIINSDAKEIKKIKKILNIDLSKKILLYAPTFRDNKSGKQQSFSGLNLNETIDELEKATKDDWLCLLRAHHAVHEGFVKQGVGEKCIDVSEYDDIADLMCVSDMMISDYSSCAGDYALTKRPLILYQGDIDEYENNSRSFYFEMSDSPYFIAHNQNELNKLIRNMTDVKAKQNCENILDFYESTESGKASETIAKIIIEQTRKEKCEDERRNI